MVDLNKVIELSKDLKLLYVEDSQSIRLATMLFLEDFFEDITVGVDGQDGLEKFKNGTFDIVITDINMPNMDGLKMAELIKKINSDVYILIISAHNETDIVHKSINKGVDGYLFKPLNIDELIPLLLKVGTEIKNLKDANKLRKKEQERKDKRIDKIIARSDKRQAREYAELQRQYDEISALKKEIEDTQKEVIYTMGSIAESRSKETGLHVKRVAEYTYLFAIFYGLPESECQMLKQASPMHDIGKIAIPDTILNKPGRFDVDERAIMETHAQLGYDMLKHSNRELLKMATIVAYEHHEKYNGTGYPNQTKGEDIHIYGRITALADVFDALGSSRVYKEAWNDEKIFKMFKEERGEHFDPKLIDIFFDNLDQFLYIRDTMRDIK